MTYQETKKEVAHIEELHTELVTLAATPATPAEVAAQLTPRGLEALAAIVKEYSHDPRMSTAAKRWADNYTTCHTNNGCGIRLSCKLHVCHIDQTARAAAALNNR